MKTSFKYDASFIRYSHMMAPTERCKQLFSAQIKRWRDRRPCAPGWPRCGPGRLGEQRICRSRRKRFMVGELKERRFVKVEEVAVAPLPPRKRGWWPYARE